MTATATELPDGIGFDFSDVENDIEAQPGPLSNSRSPRGPGRPRGRRSASAKRLEILQKKLSSEMFQLGTLAGLAVPVTGYYACQESDAFTKAVIQLAAKRPEWVEALEHVADIGPGLVVGRTALGLGASFAVDRGRADPEKRAMKFLGVHAAWKAVTDNTEGKFEEGSAYVPPPGAFVPVS